MKEENVMFKKAVSIVLAMAVGLSVACCAKKEDMKTIDLSGAGVKIEIPEEVSRMTGTVHEGLGYEVVQNSGFYISSFGYYAFPESKLEELDSLDEITDEDYNFLKNNAFLLLYVFTIDGNRGTDDANAILNDLDMNYQVSEPAATVGEYNFFIIDNPNNIDPAALDVDQIYKDEIGRLLEIYSDHSLIQTFEPVPADSAAEGTLISFETYDLDGNVINSADLFAQNKVTMINIWGTECGPCIDEMPMLGELNGIMQSEGCAVVGIVSDLRDFSNEDIRGTAQQIVSQTGADYINLAAWETLDTDLPYSFTPSTYFVDSEGHIIGEIVIGIRTEAQYTELYHNALDAVS